MSQESGFYVDPRGFSYFHDVDCEERWIQGETAEMDHEYERYWREHDEMLAAEAERNRWDPNFEAAPEWPAGTELQGSMDWVAGGLADE